MQNYFVKCWKLFFIFALILFNIEHATAGTVVVTNVLSNSVTLVNDTSLIPIKEIKVGYMPHEVVVTDDGKYALVSNFGDLLSVIKGNTISVIDIANSTLINTVELPKNSRPHGLALLSGTQALVTAQGIQSLLLIDYTTGALIKQLPLPGAGAHMVKVDADKRFAYVANSDSGSIVKVDLKDFFVVTERKIGREVEGMAFNAEGDVLLATDRKDNYVVGLRTKDLALYKVIPTGNGPVRVETFDKGKFALVTNTLGGNAQVIDLATFMITKSITTTSTKSLLPVPINIAVRDDQSTAFITNSFAADIALVDLVKGEVIKSFTAGYMPDGVALSKITATDTDNTDVQESEFLSGPVDIHANIEKVWTITKTVNDYNRISNGAITANVDGVIEAGKIITLELYKDKIIGKFIPKSEETVSVVDDDHKLIAWVRKLPDGSYTERYQILEKVSDNVTRSTIILHIPGPIGVITKATYGKLIDSAFEDLHVGIKKEAEKA